MKKIISILVILCGLLFSKVVFAQVNLVPNPSFEDTTSCPDWWGQIDHAQYWYSASAAGTPDYFNSCNNDIFSVPNNVAGYSSAQDGHSYIGLASYYEPFYNVREIIQVPLFDALIKDKKYKLSFYIKLAHDVSMYAINCMGCLITEQPVFLTSDSLTKYSPQINYFDTILDDSINWSKIEGEFIAQGNEKYISIGNFMTDTEITINIINNNADDPAAYYYIDNVSLIKISSDTTDTTNHEQFFNVYPTLTNEIIYLDYNNIEINKTHFVLSDICGRKVKDIIITESTTKKSIDITGLSNGMYLYSLIINRNIKYSGKLILAK